MTDLRKAAEMAIEVLERTGTVGNYAKKHNLFGLITAEMPKPTSRIRTSFVLNVILLLLVVRI